MLIFPLTVIAVGSLVVEQVLCARTVRKCKSKIQTNHTIARIADNVSPSCFPAVGFKMPTVTPTSLTNWWCNADTEYAFVGFSYDISNCDFLQDQCFFICSPPLPFQVRVWRNWKPTFRIWEKRSMQDTCDCMNPAITKDFSKLGLFEKKNWL